MNLFRMTSLIEGIDRMEEFLENNFVCMGWKGIGDLENVGAEELHTSLAGLTEACERSDRERGMLQAEISAFVHTMRDGDYVLVPAGDVVHLGDLGDYYYVEETDSEHHGTVHRRGVTWLNEIAKAELNEEVREWLDGPGEIAIFDRPAAETGLAHWIDHPFGAAHKLPRPEAGDSRTSAQPHATMPRSEKVDPQLVAEALDILKLALRSEDPERRERAAIAILNYAK
ncbi:hypothetical protein ACFPVX_05665 [Cohnella faecalis]|uniref:Uncharacterized protein n=1 Tax=Cohnella faecalis TaxID=2315694 RepID=A0A398CBT0_9BACL|nr:hypothetical protein [Cohnella faecalis]RIE00233.1 hypothetical protein D3H35_29810 [Cohnella faecalis]